MIQSRLDQLLFVCASSGNVHRCGSECADITVLPDQSRVCAVVGLFYGYEMQDESPLFSPRFSLARSVDDGLKADAKERLACDTSSVEALHRLIGQYEIKAFAIAHHFLFSDARRNYELSRIRESHAKLNPLIYRMVALESMDSGRPVSTQINLLMIIMGEAIRLRTRNLLPRVTEAERTLMLQRIAKLSARLFVAFEQADKSAGTRLVDGPTNNKKKDSTYQFVYHVISVMYCTSSPSGVRDTNGRLLLLPVPMLDKVIPPEEDLTHLNLEKRLFSRTEVMFRKKLTQLFRVN